MTTETLSFITAGDVAPQTVDPAEMLGPAAALFAKADLSFVNVEHPLSTAGKPTRGKKFLHRGLKEHLTALAASGLTAANLANNHIMDFGDDGLLDTMSAFESAGVATFGAGPNLAAARAPLIVRRGGLSVGLIGVSTLIPSGTGAGADQPGIYGLRVRTAYRIPHNLEEAPGTPPVIETWPEAGDLVAFTDAIAELRRQVDVVLVYAHWGASLVGAVHHHQTVIGRAAIDAGAAAVFGGHQHVVSGVEFYKGAPIVHCTGNLVFDAWEPWFDDAARRGILFGATLTKAGLTDCYILPCATGVNGPPELVDVASPVGAAVLADLQAYSAAYGTVLDPQGGRIGVAAGQPTGLHPIHQAALHPLGFPSADLSEARDPRRMQFMTTGEAFHAGAHGA